MVNMTESNGKSKDEEDLQERSTKQHKENSLDGVISMEGVISMDTLEVETTTDNNKADGGTASTKS
jgi:hypothetical protein